MKKTQKPHRFRLKKLFLNSSLLFLLCCMFPLHGFADDGRTITGVVMDERNDPAIGATIILKQNKSIGTITDVDGKFSVKIPNDNTVLVISMLGYKTQEITVGNQTTLTVNLEEDAYTLAAVEVVEIGFQSRKKVNLTGAISSVGKEVFENRPVINVGQALQGVVPNLNINIASGSPDAVPSINMRGATSLEYDNDQKKFVLRREAPLIMIDGVEVDQTQLNQMNPNDIANVSFLKDASAAAIYGTRANNGVMLITTKSGKFDQKPVISYGVDFSWEKAANIPKILDSYTHKQAQMDLKAWTNGTVTPDDYEILEGMAKYRDDPRPENAYLPGKGDNIIWVANTNPFDVLMKSWAPTMKHNFSVSGGSTNVNYYVSLGYVDQDGLYDYKKNSYKRYNANAQINAKVASWFNLGTKISYNETSYSAPFVSAQKGTIWNAMKGGEVNRNLNTPLTTGPNDPVPNALTENILNYLDATREKTRRTAAVFTLSPEFIIIPKELKVRADLSFTPKQYEHQKVQAKQGRVFGTWTSLSTDHTNYNQANDDRSTDRMYVINAYAEYNKSFIDKHNINVVLGVNQERQTFTSLYAFYDRLISPYIISANSVEDKTLNTVNNSAWERTARAVFGRLSYDYEQRYLFSLDARYDGSSRFPKSDRFQFFPTFSLAWRLSEEAFMSSTRSWLDNLKLRYSWGKLGSQPNVNYPYQAVYGTGNAGYIIDGSYPGSLTAPGLVTPGLTWQKTAMNNFGIETTMLGSKLDFSFDFYVRKVTDILVDGAAKYPALLGASAPRQNSGELKVKGWEITLSWKDRLSNGLSYRIGFNMGDNFARTMSFPGNPNNIIGQLYAGQIEGDIWGYKTGGILQESDFDGVDANGFPIYNGADQSSVGGKQLFPGMVWYQDLNGDGKIDSGSNTTADPGDRVILGNSSPRYTYGITGNVSFKGFDLDFLFDGIGKRDLWLGGNYWGAGAGNTWMLARSWRPDRTDARYPMYQSGGLQTQSKYLVDGSYFRLKQLMLGYTLPQNITKKLGANKLRVTLSGYNIFEITDIPSSFDVNTISDQYPLSRTISVGAQIEF